MKLDENDTDMGSCFPIQVIVFVGFNSPDGTQTVSKSKMAIFFSNKVCTLVYSLSNSSNFSNNVSRRV